MFHNLGVYAKKIISDRIDHKSSKFYFKSLFYILWCLPCLIADDAFKNWISRKYCARPHLEEWIIIDIGLITSQKIHWDQTLENVVEEISSVILRMIEQQDMNQANSCFLNNSVTKWLHDIYIPEMQNKECIEIPISNQGNLIYYNIGVKYKIEIEMIYILLIFPHRSSHSQRNHHIRPQSPYSAYLSLKLPSSW